MEELGRNIKLGIFLVVLIGLLTAGNTTAYFTDADDASEAKFSMVEVGVSFVGNPAKSPMRVHVDNHEVNCFIENSGSNDIYLRVKPKGETRLDDGRILHRPADKSWVKGEDDYYYHTRILEPGEVVEFAMKVDFDTWEEVIFPDDLEVEAIQASNNAMEETWPDNPILLN